MAEERTYGSTGTTYVSGNSDVTLVSRYVGFNNNDVETLCTSYLINQWAKWKPVRHRSPAPLSLLEIQKLHFGLNPRINTAARNVIPGTGSGNTNVNDAATWQAVIDGSKTWEYIRPSLSEGSGLRLSDFCDPENPKLAWGYDHYTPPPVDNFRNWRLSRKNLLGIISGPQATTSPGSGNQGSNYNLIINPYSWSNSNNTISGYSVIYSGLTFKFGSRTWENVNGAHAHVIPLNELLQVSAENKYYRMALGVKVPGASSLELFISRYTFFEAAKLTTSSAVVQAILPDIASNQYLCKLLYEYVQPDDIYKEVEAVPLIVSNAFLNGISRDGAYGQAYQGQAWSRVTLNSDVDATSEVYSMPANTSVIKIQIINDVNKTADDLEIAETFNLYVKQGDIVYVGGTASWNKFNVNTLHIEYIKETALTKPYTISYSVTVSFITGVSPQGVANVVTETRTGTHTFPVGTKAGDPAADFLVGSGQPGLSYSSYEIKKV